MPSACPQIWSIRFSGDSREIVAGANQGTISVFDVEARKRVLRIQGHHDDVNAVAFADAGSSNVLLSGSDDSFVKVWDRRSLSGGKPAGVLPGHTEGVTYVSPKGDGRYCISNAKDQSVKLWDLRSLVSSSDFERDPTNRMDVGLTHWDYRNATYRKPRFQQRPNDCSVMTYRGHAVLQTLIRCHFSPAATTGQQYIYSGSADGRIHVSMRQVISACASADHTASRSGRSMAASCRSSTATRRRRCTSLARALPAATARWRRTRRRP